MRLSSIGLIGGALLIGAVSAAPSFAGTPASISGSATLITPGTFTSTVSGESVLPSGFLYETQGGVLTPAPGANQIPPGANPNATITGDSSVIVVPTYTIAGATFVTNSLSLAVSVAPTALPAGSSFSATAASVLNTISTAAAGAPALANIDFISAIIKAGAGVNGLD